MCFFRSFITGPSKILERVCLLQEWPSVPYLKVTRSVGFLDSRFFQPIFDSRSLPSSLLSRSRSPVSSVQIAHSLPPSLPQGVTEAPSINVEIPFKMMMR
ncbi:hypothetical protein ABKN59_001493 [Abortiporus biennis]